MIPYKSTMGTSITKNKCTFQMIMTAACSTFNTQSRSKLEGYSEGPGINRSNYCVSLELQLYIEKILAGERQIT